MLTSELKTFCQSFTKSPVQLWREKKKEKKEIGDRWTKGGERIPRNVRPQKNHWNLRTTGWCSSQKFSSGKVKRWRRIPLLSPLKYHFLFPFYNISPHARLSRSISKPKKTQFWRKCIWVSIYFHLIIRPILFQWIRKIFVIEKNSYFILLSLINVNLEYIPLIIV